MLEFHVLASGSKGNAALVVENQSGESILIDCGICKRDFFKRSEEIGVDLAKLKAICITHEHTDHTKGLGVVTRGLAKRGINPFIYVSREVYRSSKDLRALRDDCMFEAFSDEGAISIAGMQVYPFATSHDSIESYGFRIEEGQDSLGYLTDNGIVSDKIFHYLRDVRILALESNHDGKMLANGDYPFIIKRRIASDEGHLSNAQAAEALETLLHAGLEHVIAMHVSENNNTYRMPKEALQAVVSSNNHPAQISIGYQHLITSVR